MRFGRSHAVLLVVFLLVLGLTAACGGGEESDSPDGEGSGGGNAATEEAQGEQGGTSPEAGSATTTEQGGQTGEATGEPPETKIAIGDIASVNTGTQRIVLDPVEGEQLEFRVVPNAQVMVDDSPMRVSDLQEGQQAQISYVTVNDRNRARAVYAFSEGGTSE